ncbi:hypothetical protein Q0F98_33765 [Paenibacillus amylolyticus]|nr:hypothetical protein Q0F98_33765 [Paenibacillus amylolyticus]
MNCVAVLPYYKVQREVTGLAQQIEMNARSMILYSDKIVTKYQRIQHYGSVRHVVSPYG